jgi:hypothetical protein
VPYALITLLPIVILVEISFLPRLFCLAAWNLLAAFIVGGLMKLRATLFGIVASFDLIAMFVVLSIELRKLLNISLLSS